MDACIFCKIIKGEAPSYMVDENADVLIFLSLDNHPLVVPRQHVEALYDLDDVTGAALMRQAVRVARALKEGLARDGVYTYAGERQRCWPRRVPPPPPPLSALVVCCRSVYVGGYH